MNEARDLEHPDITRAQQTGYPWFPRKITVEATEEDARAYCLEQFPAFFSAMMAAFPSAVTGFLDVSRMLLFAYQLQTSHILRASPSVIVSTAAVSYSLSPR